MRLRAVFVALGVAACHGGARREPAGGAQDPDPAGRVTPRSGRSSAAEEGAPGPDPDLGGETPPAVGDRALASDTAASGSSTPSTAAAAPAGDDAEYASREPLSITRVVYRWTLDDGLLAWRRRREPTLPVAAAELHVDLDAHRLRARFVGGGWPLEPGSEVRLRSDDDGVYAFDSRGGTRLPPGMARAWFSGGEVRTSGALPRLHYEGQDRIDDPAGMFCALLAELAGARRDELVPRCVSSGVPRRFRLGAWRAERTAVVPVTVARETLRASARARVDRVAATQDRAFLDPRSLAQVSPSRPARRASSGEPSEGVRVRNEGSARGIVVVGGAPVGWVAGGATAHFVGLRPGVYTFAVLRPLGERTPSAHEVTVPGEITIR